ncbi:hypothetical protein BZA70DRAFT_276352 [Myxozyma melibiosi]|uniref:JmjC domain-containing histone demethylation protein 1 n=1 Tax=Myxozyma melibiosi TaxID=54550 RepID=A0ABR1F918_9ASCO
MERSGIETLLEAAALDAAEFFGQPPAPNRPPESAYSEPQNYGPSLAGQQQQQPQQPLTHSAVTYDNRQHVQPNTSRMLPLPLSHSNQKVAAVYSPMNSPDVAYAVYTASYKHPYPVEQQPSPYTPLELSPAYSREPPSDSKTIDVKSDHSSPAEEQPSSQSQQEVWDSCKLCTPETSLQGQVDWIECSVCQTWYHYFCVGLTAKNAKNVDEFHCPPCVKTHGPSTLLRKSKRKHAHIDYAALHEGEGLTTDQHPYCQLIKDRAFTPESFPRISGHELTKDLARSGGISQPVIIPGDKIDGLGLEVPAGLTVRKVADLVGHDTKVEVIDVPTQHESPNWDLGKWTDYYETSAEARDRVRNVISLEVSYTKLGDLIQRPQYVRETDLSQIAWPEDLKNKGRWPKVSLYCLMSVENAYTDYHIDFGGSSVFYHVIEGTKVFLFAPPTAANLSKYEHWCLSSDQSKIFFGDMVKECYKVTLQKGDTMIIPSGWIHAVFTPTDSLVIGGNFLTSRDLSMEITISKIEKKTKVPRKFRFPFFSKLLWYTASDVMRRCAESPDALNEIKQDAVELGGLADLAEYIHQEALIATGRNDSATALEVKAAKNSVIGLLKDAVIFSKVFGNWVSTVSDGKHTFDWASMSEEEEAEATLRGLRDLKNSGKKKQANLRSSPADAAVASPSVPDAVEDSTVNRTAEEDEVRVKTEDGLKADVNMENSDELKSEFSAAEKSQAAVAEDHQTDKDSSEAMVLKEEKAERDENLSTGAPQLPKTEVKQLDMNLSSDPPLESDGLSPPPATDDLEAEELEEARRLNEPEIKSENPPLSSSVDEDGGQSLYSEEQGEEEDPAYDSDAVSETSTVIGEEVVQNITSEEGKKKNYKIYEELMQLYSSRTRRSMQALQDQSVNGTSSKKSHKDRRSSVPAKRKHDGYDDDEDDDSEAAATPSRRSRRKSTPGGKRSARQLCDSSNGAVRTSPRQSARKNEESSSKQAVKRGRGRPRGPNSKLYAMEENQQKRQTVARDRTSERSSSSGSKRSSKMAEEDEVKESEDDVLQRLIREAQLGIRSRR